MRTAIFSANLLLLLACLTVSASARAEPQSATTTDWLEVRLDGQSIGQLESRRTVRDGQVHRVDALSMRLSRSGTELAFDSRAESTETLDGSPVAFRALSRGAGSERTVSGELISPLRMRVQVDGDAEAKEQAWVRGALLGEGADLRLRAHGLKPGTSFSYVGFEPESLLFMPVDVRLVGWETLRIDGAERKLFHVDQSVTVGGSAMRISHWYNADFELERALMPMMGLNFELVASERATMLTDAGSFDLLDAMLLGSPRALSEAELAQPLRYRITLDDPNARLINTAGQRTVRRGAGWEVRVDPLGGDPTPPNATDTSANRWLEATDMQIVAAARKATAGAPDAAAKMAALTAFARARITDKTLAIGYASALETLAAQAGDCTEHAVLLAALARSIGIPARVVSGLAYAPEFEGRTEVFVPHAWVQAWTGAQWRAFDAALTDGFGAGHIALAAGNGEPAGFLSAAAVLGQIRIERIDAEPIARQ